MNALEYLLYHMSLLKTYIIKVILISLKLPPVNNKDFL